MLTSKTQAINKVRPPKHSLWASVVQNKWLYIFLFPVVLYFIIFHYIPIFGLAIAFQDFNFIEGISASPWVGLKHFRALFASSTFWTVLKNSLVLSFLRLLFSFPVPIILAIMLNELRGTRYKKFAQTVVYLPHFISWVIVVGMVYNIFATSDGLINVFLKNANLDPIRFLDSSQYFRQTLISTEIWKTAGWGSIVYLAALTGIDPELYEAAKVDGAGRIRRIWSITLPCISGTIAVLLTLRMGNILNNGFEQIFLLYNPMVYDVADVLETYSYRLGILEGRFSYTTAMGIFKSAIALLLLISSNKISKKLGGATLY